MSHKNKSVAHPKWSYSANLYEVNLRQYTKEGTFDAFSKHLPRLKDMGVKILWFMPVTPISETGRLGVLGSYYSVKNYKETNPEFGSISDFKSLVEKAHELGFKVIIDWVANHSGNDHPWVTEHPEFYCYIEGDQLLHPHGWTDVAQLNYNNANLRESMISAMKFWLKECDIDGYRCDMAHLVPLDFWVDAKRKLSKFKDNLFWLGECENPEYHAVFDATYTWRWMHATEDFCHHKINLQALLTVLYKSATEFPYDAFRTYFTSNHDENSWNGTEEEKYGDAAQLLAVFSCTWNGIPMIYSGQEMPNKKRLKFFEKDPIEWDGEFNLHSFYKTLLILKSSNRSLRAGDPEVLTKIISHTGDHRVFSFLRKNKDAEVLVILNFSAEEINFQVNEVQGIFKNVFGGNDVSFDREKHTWLSKWGYLVFEKLPMLSDLV